MADIEPTEVVQAVEEYVYRELRDRDRFENREPLDEAGIYSLHMLAARVYALGFDAGERAAGERARAETQRLRDRAAARPTGQEGSK